MMSRFETLFCDVLRMYLSKFVVWSGHVVDDIIDTVIVVGRVS